MSSDSSRRPDDVPSPADPRLTPEPDDDGQVPPHQDVLAPPARARSAGDQDRQQAEESSLTASTPDLAQDVTAPSTAPAPSTASGSAAPAPSPASDPSAAPDTLTAPDPSPATDAAPTSSGSAPSGDTTPARAEAPAEADAPQAAGSTSAAQPQPQSSPTPPEPPEEDQPGPDAPLLPLPKPSTATPAELEPITELPSDIGKPISEAEVRRHLEELSGRDGADASGTGVPGTSAPGTDGPGTRDGSGSNTPGAPGAAPVPASSGPSGSPAQAPAAPAAAPETAPAGPAAQAPAGLPSTPAAQAAEEAVTTEEAVTPKKAHERLTAASSLDQPPLAADVPEEQPSPPATAPTTRPEAPRLRRYQPPTGDAALEDTAVRRRALLSLDPQPGEDAPPSTDQHLPTSRDAADPRPADQGSQSATRSPLPASPSAAPDSAPARLEESAAAASLLGDPPGTSASPESLESLESPDHQAGAHDHPGRRVPEPEGTEDPGSRQDLQASSPAASSAATPSAAAPDTTSPDTTASDVPPSPLPAAASTGTPDSATSVPSASSRTSSAPSRRSRPRGSHRRETPREESRAARRPGSRAASHWAGVLVAVALLPLAWFLVHDGAVLMTGGDASVWPDSVNVRGATELACGAAAFVAALFMAHRSSLGTYVVGGLGLFFGLPFLVAPAAVASLVGPTVERLQAHSSLGEALTSYVMADGLTGRFVLMGLLMVMVGVVSDSARRAGRRERTAPDEPDRETDN